MTDNFVASNTITYGASSENSQSLTLVTVPQPRRIYITIPSVKEVGRFINRTLVVIVAFGLVCLGVAHVFNFFGSLPYRSQTIWDLLNCYMGYGLVLIGLVMTHALTEI